MTADTADMWGTERAIARWVFAVIGGLAVLALIVVGGWRLGWWMKSSATGQTAHILQQSYGAQSAYVEQTRNAISQIASVGAQLADPSTPTSEHDALVAQRAAMTTQACNTAANIATPPADISRFQADNCKGTP